MFAISQDHIDKNTPLGANLVAGGATFRAWAPAASEVHLKLNQPNAAFVPGSATPDEMIPTIAGAASNSGVKDVGCHRSPTSWTGRQGLGRDPYAREMGLDPAPLRLRLRRARSQFLSLA